MPSSTQHYAEVILPLPLEATFTYSVPPRISDTIAVGHRVIVPFGRKKYLTGIVCALSPKAPERFETKEIAAILDERPIVRHPQLKMWQWVADYYMCAIGDVYKAAVPSGLKVESETFVEINPDYEADEQNPMSESEAIITQLLDHEGHMTVDAIQKQLGEKSVARAVSAMIEKGMLIISEKIVERYRSLRIKYVRPTFTLQQMPEAFATVKRSPQQERLLMALIEMSGLTRPAGQQNEVGRKQLLERSGVSATILQALVKRGLAEIYTKEVNRFKYDGSPKSDLPTLSDEQIRAFDEIHDVWRDKPTALLHGVTASGKTEIYSRLIDEALHRGEQVLYLVPEIALTTQLTRRLQKIFGDRIVVYHSKFSDNERVDIWKTMLSDNTPRVILGARSSVFLPFSRLGLVIVDEEHDSSYKQTDPAPRYNGRDVALLLASMHGARSVLGSATPSIETFYKALNGKFGLVSLKTRFHNVPLPPVRLIDMTRARKKQEVNGALSMQVIKTVNMAINSGRQAILFRNRRGFAPMVRCKQCAWVPKCDNCDVTLTYHNYSRQLVCHYCGATYQLPTLCPQCRQPAIEVVGYGTERIEEDIEQMFPGRKVIRLDLDTTRNKDSYETLIEEFSEHKADILVGTQMVTKGLDFKDVSSVVVVNADELINVPDFKASERAFCMLEQVAGRAGRAASEGTEVLVQTYKPDLPLFPFLVAHDYDGFYEYEINERQQFSYPPFYHIIYIYLKHRDSSKLTEFSNAYANCLANMFGKRVSGPDQPKVARVKSLYIQKIMLKIESNASMTKVRSLLREAYLRMAAHPTMKSAIIYYDIDP